jgi:NAD(P)-dependent dehydrogenase (short-subunit alcohol dehydrogenase family)
MADRFRLLPSPVYKISKAALNRLTVQYAKQRANEGLTLLGISLGVNQDSVRFLPVGRGFIVLLTPAVAPHRPWRFSGKPLG